MSEGSGILSANATWLLETWLEKLSGVIESMVEEQPHVTWTVEGDEELGEHSLTLEQRFAAVPDPMIWLGLPEPVHQELGGRVLSVAGLETSGVEENRATCLEILEQSLAGLTGALNQRISREVKREQARECPFFPSGLTVIRVLITLGDKQLEPLWIAFAPLLTSWLDSKPEEPVVSETVTKETEAPQDSYSGSRTFDVLLDVALPVSVSFGKAELAVKDVLKLTTGSIVELNRSVSEPVDIIVNGCTIARGEVVVVEGNYGVRINNIVSRKERLRTGGAAVAESRSRMSSN